MTLRHDCGGTIRQKMGRDGVFYVCRFCMKKVDIQPKSKGSGQIAGPTYYRQFRWKVGSEKGSIA